MMNELMAPLQEHMFAGNTLDRWVLALLATAVTALILWLIRIIGKRLGKHEITQPAARSARRILTTIARSISILFIIGFSLFIGSGLLSFSDSTSSWIHSGLSILLFIQIGIWLNAFLTAAARRYERQHMETNAGKVTTARALTFVGRIFIFILIGLAVLDNIPGVEITTLIAGLGVGGIAVALALQNILGDLFASLSISLDKPFAIGDFIIVDNFLGSVENIGLKTTRIRSLGGEQLVFSNNDLLKSRIRNYKRMAQRRVPFSVGVTYQTPPEKLRKVPDIFKKQLEPFDDVHFDRAHFKAYGAYSLEFEFVYYVHTPDYNRYMDIQQAINLGLYEDFAAEGIEFAYPTQTLYIDRAAGDELRPGSE
jgi:small-conductance mechanosensitive channel